MPRWNKGTVVTREYLKTRFAAEQVAIFLFLHENFNRGGRDRAAAAAPEKFMRL
jgi:hypothetical protein